MRLVAISGSLRTGSLNSALIRAAASVAPEGAQIHVETLEGIPLYNGDDEAAHGLPRPVAALKEALASAGGLILATPEYNNSMPGVLKNAFDWLSRPNADVARVFGGLPVALMGVSPGRFGTVLAQNAWLPVFRTLGANLWSGRLLVANAGGLFDDRPELRDETTLRRLTSFVADFLDYSRAVRRPGDRP